jgi:hypothetical protein
MDYSILLINSNSSSSKKSNLKPKTQKAVTVLTNNAPKQKRKKLNEEGVNKIIKSLENRNVKMTKTNILNELSLFGFGKTDVNYKMVRAVIAP